MDKKEDGALGSRLLPRRGEEGGRDTRPERCLLSVLPPQLLCPQDLSQPCLRGFKREPPSDGSLALRGQSPHTRPRVHLPLPPQGPCKPCPSGLNCHHVNAHPDRKDSTFPAGTLSSKATLKSRPWRRLYAGCSSSIKLGYLFRLADISMGFY